MNQTHKRITSMLLSCAMLLTLLPAGALAAENGVDEESTVSATMEDSQAEETFVSTAGENGAAGESAVPDAEESGTSGETVVSAEVADDSAPAFAGGSGTQEDPYCIDTLEQLKAFRDSVNSGERYQGKYIRLTADLDLADEAWTPIGRKDKPFQGTFDGAKEEGDGNHVISNLRIEKEFDNTADNCYLGLFGLTNSPAVIKNVNLENVDIRGSLYVGAVVGYGFTGKEISNCHVSGAIHIDAWWYAGGIGGNGYVSTVSNCSVSGDAGSYIRANNDGSYMGGIWGYRGEGNLTISDCSVSGLAISGADRVGGISGQAHYQNTIQRCTISDSSITTVNHIGNTGLIAGADLSSAANGVARILDCTVENTTATSGGVAITTKVGACDHTGAPANQPATVGSNVVFDSTGKKVTGGKLEQVSLTQLADSVVALRYDASGTFTPCDSLQTAVSGAADGDTIKLLADVNLNEAVSFDGSSYALAIEKSLTIDGSSGGEETHTITMSTPRGIAVKGGSAPVTVTFENIRLVQTSGRSCIETRGGVDALSLNGAVLDASGTGGNAQALTIGGNQQAPARVHIKDSQIRANAAGYAVIVYNPVEMAVENSQISGYAALYFKAPSSSQGSNGSAVTVMGGSVLEGTNANPQADGANAFGTVVFEDDNITLTVRDATVSASAPETSDRQQVISFSYYNGWNESEQVVTGNRVFFQSGAAANVNGAQAVFSLEKEGNTIAITGGTYNFDPTAYVPDGYVVDGSGPYTVGEKPAPHPPTGGGSSSSGGSTSGDKTEVTTHPDGSTTTTVTKPNGTVTETTTRPDGTVSTTTVTETGRVESQVEISQGAVNAAGENGTVSLPIPAVPAGEDRDQAPTVTVNLPGNTSARVEIPVENVTSGTVAVLVKADGTEEVIKTSLTTENGVTVTLSGGETVKIVDNSKTFVDVGSAHWGAEAIDFASSRELFAGTSATTFSPEGEMTRAMVVTVLARYEGVDTTSGNTWYEAGSRWAVENGISDGSDLEGAVTREQLAAMLWRYAGSPAATGSTEGFADGAQVSPWAAGAMAWAVETGLLSGMGDGTLNPQGQATRAQVAAILTRFVEMTNR